MYFHFPKKWESDDSQIKNCISVLYVNTRPKRVTTRNSKGKTGNKFKLLVNTSATPVRHTSDKLHLYKNSTNVNERFYPVE